MAEEVVDILLGRLVSKTIEGIGLNWGMEKDLEFLRRGVTRIRAMLADAEERQVNDASVSLWLGELRSLAYDVEDTLDEVETEALRQTVEGEAGPGRIRRRSMVRGLFSFSQGDDQFRRSVSDRVARFRGALDELVKAGSALRLGGRAFTSLRASSFTRRRPPSGYSADDRVVVVGRDAENEEIVSGLLEVERDGGGPFSVVSIVGMGGLGKTTLAQLVYNDPRIRDHFEIRAWVWVGDESDLHGKILIAAEANAGFSGKRFLLVLDDVWSVDLSVWERVTDLLMAAETGSKVLVTSRNEAVARSMGGGGRATVFRLCFLADEDCWQIFRRYAFSPDGCSATFPNLEAIGRALVCKVRGLPLAAKQLGALLRSETEESVWLDVLHSEVWELDETEILRVLRLSYAHLPAHLKWCFAFCSIFPLDFVFDKSELVQMWMAHGFIRPSGGKSLEDVGGDYFDDLLLKSFFQSVGDGYAMHDLIHDLAICISGHETLLVGDGFYGTYSPHIRHVSLLSNDLRKTDFYALQNIHGLRTLQLRHRGRTCHNHHVPVEPIIKLRYLRVLVLHCQGIKELPEGIGELKLLRYLDLSFTSIIKLPETLTKIYNLQTLKLEHCPLLVLPRGMSSLVNMRHLHADPSLVAGICKIGKLTALQGLKEFVVHSEDGYRIGELKDMNQLHGCLTVRNLENVQTGEEAYGAHLSHKSSIRDLVLEWGRGDDELSDAGIYDEVLEGLQPDDHLRMLHIKNYDGVSSPSWLYEQCDLVDVFVENCRKWDCLPSLAQLPSLKLLGMRGMGLKHIGHETKFSSNGGFTSLEELRLHDMIECEEWSGVGDGESFPNLKRLWLQNCPKLMEFSKLPPVLIELNVMKVGLTSLPEIQRPQEFADDGSLSLSVLCISDCPRLTSLFGGKIPYQLKFLSKLSIIACKELMCLPGGWFGALVSLRSLTMEECPKLKCPHGSDLPSSLELLKLRECPGVVNKSFFTNLPSLASISSSLITKVYPDLHACAEEAWGCLKMLNALKIGWCDGHAYMSERVPLQQVSFKHVINKDSSEPKDKRPFSEVDLEIWYLKRVSVDLGTVTGYLSVLTSLDINGWPDLVSLLAKDLMHLSKLEKLSVTDCKELTSFELPPLHSLKYLKIENCYKLSSITCEDLAGCSSLQILQLIGFNKLPSMSPELMKIVSFD